MATIKKAQNGYDTKTSPLKTGPYEKKLDTVGKGSSRSVRMIDGKGGVMGQERLGSSGAKKLTDTFKKAKAYTDDRRKQNKDFLDSRAKSGEAATASMKKAKCGSKMSKK